MCKVPAHIWIKGNEEADRAVKEAIYMPGMTPTILQFIGNMRISWVGLVLDTLDQHAWMQHVKTRNLESIIALWSKLFEEI